MKQVKTNLRIAVTTLVFTSIGLISLEARPSKVSKHIKRNAEQHAEVIAKLEESKVKENGKSVDATPTLNRQTRILADRIEHGKKSGLLSSSQVRLLQRDLDKLIALEEKSKAKEGLSTKEREKLYQQAIELRAELYKELRK